MSKESRNMDFSPSGPFIRHSEMDAHHCFPLVGLMDHLIIKKAHILGASMGRILPKK